MVIKFTHHYKVGNDIKPYGASYFKFDETRINTSRYTSTFGEDSFYYFSFNNIVSYDTAWGLRFETFEDVNKLVDDIYVMAANKQFVIYDLNKRIETLGLKVKRSYIDAKTYENK